MKKDTILILVAVVAILALVLSKPVGTIIPLIILIPVVIYLIVDIIKNGNEERLEADHVKDYETFLFDLK